MEYMEALALGLRRYNTGRACRKGHFADRVTSSRTCRQCQYEAMKAWVAANPEKHRGSTRNWMRKRRASGYNEKAKERMRGYYRKKLGIPPATRPCPAHCESCSRELINGKNIHLDHDHTTGKFRGWLCNRCNLGIGSLGDCMEGLESAISYLQRAKG